MRRTLFCFCSTLLPLAATAAVAIAAGCSAEAATDQGTPPTTPAVADTTAGGETRSPGPVDAGAFAAVTSRGSPLCHATATTCLPDDDGVSAAPYPSVACASAPDGGTKTVDASVKGCRIAAADNAPPTCAPGATPHGVDGVLCEKSSDCAPGFDCVDGEKGPTCRRYCCAGSCEGQTSQNGGPTFCDIQKLVGQKHPAPVCMPIKTCKLLEPGECGRGETCAIVDEQGTSGCVPAGMAKEGQSCDDEHCAADPDLTCLGSPGDRRCYKLCKTDSATCGTTKTCTTAAVFQNTTFGVCKTP